jgi:hypothetical protein
MSGQLPVIGGHLPVVVGLGPVDPALVTRVLDGHCRFVPDPGEAELSVAAGAIVRAEALVDQALLDQAPALRVVARTGVGVELIDVPAATACGIAVVITPGAGAAAVAEGAIGMALHLVKRFGPLTALVRAGRWAPCWSTAVAAPSSTPTRSGGPWPPGSCPGSASTFSTPSRPARTRCTTTPTSSSLHT